MNEPQPISPPPIAHTLDAVMGATIIGTLMGWLPPIATGLSIIWFLMQMVGYIRARRVVRKSRRRKTDE